MERNTRAAGRLFALLFAIFAAVDARGQTAGSAPPLVIRGPENAAEVEARREAAEALVADSETAMGRRLDPAYRARVVDRLASGRAEGRSTPPGRGVTSALGDTGSDLVYTPVTPCRVFDTRIAGGAMVPGAPRSFVVAGTERFEAQGGQAGGCGVPLGPATAVVVNLVAVGPSGNGHLRAWADADPLPAPPMASVLNFGTVAGLAALANGVVLPTCDAAAVGVSCPSDLRLQAYGSSTHVVGDVLGYFRKADLESALLVGAFGFGSTTATAGTLHLVDVIVTTPPKLVDCVVTCSITIASAAPNSSGYAYAQGGESWVDGTAIGWGGLRAYVAPIAASGASSATTVSQVTLGSSLRFKFGCYVSAAGDFLGDELTGAVSWVCR
jgi:hypothetical protein